MLFVLIAIIFVVCVYSIVTYTRQTVPRISTMSKKSVHGIGGSIEAGTDIGEITNDDSDLFTEQSSTSHDGSEKEKIESEDSTQKFIGAESQRETLNYTQMKIEEPPSFLNTEYGVPQRVVTMQNYLKKFIKNVENNGDEDHDDIFERKKNDTKDKAPLYNYQAGSSSSKSGSTNRKPRKPRGTRNRVNKNESKTFDWKKKWENHSRKGILSNHDDAAGQAKDQNSDIEGSSRGDESENVSDSITSVSTVNSDETAPIVKSKKWLKHVRIRYENGETADAKKKEVKHEEFQIAGVKVKFPVKPYSSQMAVMNKLIQGCKKEEHCLLESPTGSGKTLALLCGVLAWQDHIKDEYKEQNAEAARRAREQYFIEYGGEAEAGPAPGNPTFKETHKNEPPCCMAGSSCNNPDTETIEISEDEDDQPAVKKICRSTSPGSILCQGEKLNDENPRSDDDKFFMEGLRFKTAPTIYYGSRTHKQIEQVIRELKKTAYAYKRMTILSSREFTCIQQTDANKTEVCAKLLDPTKGFGCKFYNESNRNRISSNRALNLNQINGPWDIEDLVELGRQQSACPYFAARDLMVEAEIVFCPYNYLVDPNIRQSMQINLDGQIVILDEAHNIEEMSRDVGSLFFRADKISEVLEEAELLSKIRKEDFPTYNTIKIYLKNFLQFINVNNLNSVDKFSETSSSDFWTGVQLCELFNIHSLGKSIAKDFQTAAAAAIMDFNTAKEDIARKQQDITPNPVITPVAKQFLEDLMLALQMMESEKLANDYRACIIESNIRDFNKVPDNTWTSRGATKRLRTLQMLCMNPAVIFAPLANMARSVILASGTLSPISSFQSELGTSFPHKLDANHVVPKESVYIRGIPCGPTGVALKANYTNVNSYNFQDELGRLVLNVCEVVPHGVLCFFSSYSMMQKQIDRWRLNSCWEQLEKIKHVYQEPRGSSNLEPVMKDFRDSINSTSEGPREGVTGALLLAVFRGKVAEGIDFSDNEARCVMAIGIPYAVRKDPSVDMKFNYNNLNHSKGLLKGGEWYAVQAFRALNQALGRCVRHRNDWGAVLLIDQRFQERSSYNYLPKWVKTMWRDSVRFNLTTELQQFVAYQLDRTEKEKCEKEKAEKEKAKEEKSDNVGS